MAELNALDDYILGMVDPQAPGNLGWLLQVYPDLVMRRLSHLLVTPFRAAIRGGPLAVVRYFWRVARSALRF